MRLIVAVLLIFLASSCAFAQDFSSLEERMTYNEFKAAGLDKLSPEELEQLNSWLRNRALSAPATVQQTEIDRRGLSQSAKVGDRITSRILGKFTGWRGTASTFELENGMVWKSTDPAATLAVNLTDPTVTLTPGFFDAWFLEVEGYNSRVRVKRIK